MAGITPPEGTYEVRRAPSVNILLVGRSSVGKSTMLKTLLDPTEGARRTGYSTTKDPIFETLCVEDPNVKDAFYQLNIIDTPGLMEKRTDETKKRDDETLLKLAAKCMANSITKLHFVCFVSEAGKTSMLDLNPFKRIKSFLGNEFSSVSCLILTNAEAIDDEKKTKFAADIAGHPQAGEIHAFCQKGVAFVGCLDSDKVDSWKEAEMTEEELEEQKNEMLITVRQMRDDLIQKFINAGDVDPVPIKVLEECRKEYQAKCEEKVKRDMNAKQNAQETNK